MEKIALSECTRFRKRRTRFRNEYTRSVHWRTRSVQEHNLTRNEHIVSSNAIFTERPCFLEITTHSTRHPIIKSTNHQIIFKIIHQKGRPNWSAPRCI